MFYRRRKEVDWARAIEINQAALARIVAALFAMLGLAEGGVLEKPPNAIRLAVLRILLPAESAVRRLIITVARGLVLEPSKVQSRPMPKGLAIAGNGGGRVSFQLFDPLKRFNSAPPKKKPFFKIPPRVWGMDDPHLVPSFLRYQPPPAAPLVPKPKEDTSTLCLGRRLAAIGAALNDLPRQARRFVRWQERRKAMAVPTRTTPLRPGPPPGHRKEPIEEIDLILGECHWLAWEAQKQDTS